MKVVKKLPGVSVLFSSKSKKDRDFGRNTSIESESNCVTSSQASSPLPPLHQTQNETNREDDHCCVGGESHQKPRAYEERKTVGNLLPYSSALFESTDSDFDFNMRDRKQSCTNARESSQDRIIENLIEVLDKQETWTNPSFCRSLSSSLSSTGSPFPTDEVSQEEEAMALVMKYIATADSPNYDLIFRVFQLLKLQGVDVTDDHAGGADLTKNEESGDVIPPVTEVARRSMRKKKSLQKQASLVIERIMKRSRSNATPPEDTVCSLVRKLKSNPSFDLI